MKDRTHPLRCRICEQRDDRPLIKIRTAAYFAVMAHKECAGCHK
jgi:hypothetical protein